MNTACHYSPPTPAPPLPYGNSRATPSHLLLSGAQSVLLPYRGEAPRVPRGGGLWV